MPYFAPTMAIAALLLGSNLGNCLQNLKLAVEALEKVGKLYKASQVYKTAPWGKLDQPEYLNQAVLVETSLEPELLLDGIAQIETGLGRERADKWGARRLDID